MSGRDKEEHHELARVLTLQQVAILLVHASVDQRQRWRNGHDERPASHVCRSAGTGSMKAPEPGAGPGRVARAGFASGRTFSNSGYYPGNP